MSNLKFLDAYKATSPLIQSAIDFIVSLVDEDGCNLCDFGGSKISLSFTYNKFIFIFSELDAFNFSVECKDDSIFVFSEQFNDMIKFQSYMKNGIENGFIDDFDDSHIFIQSIDSVPGDLFERELSKGDDSDEIDNSTLDDKVGKLVSINSIVPDRITRIRVVALRFNCQVIAFRFKTDVGAFDMRIEVATKFGLGGFKTEKFINLERVNGILMSSTEREKHVCVPDVSLCEEDCRRLIDAVFQCEG